MSKIRSRKNIKCEGDGNGRTNGRRRRKGGRGITSRYGNVFGEGS
jgi:hypothetical protein